MFTGAAAKCRLPFMTRGEWWSFASVLFLLPLVAYLVLSILEPQKVIFRKPTKGQLIAFAIVWSIVFCFIAIAMLVAPHARRN